MSKVAIITGASGIVGASIIEHLLQTKADDWSKIIAVSRREPSISKKDPRFVFLPIDLDLDESDIVKKLKEGGAADVTHVFYTAYVHDKNWDPNVLFEKNVPMFKKFIKSIDSIAAGLQRIVLQTGAKYYGLHIGAEGVIDDSTPRYKPEQGKPDFYFGQEDFLKEFQQGKKFKYTIYRPPIIVGVTRGNGMSMGPTLAVYFTVQKYLGKKAPFPGNEVSYKTTFDSANSDLIAQFAIWTSTLPAAENNDFIIVDSDTEKQTGEQIWKGIASYFGVEVEEPTWEKTKSLPKGKGCYALEFSFTEYMADKKELWKEIAKKHGIDENTYDYATFDFADAEFSFTWPQHLRMPKAKKCGWYKEEKPIEGYLQVFEDMKKWKMIP